MSNEYKPTYVDNTDNSISFIEGTDTISFCKPGTKINTLSAKNVVYKKSGEDLNLCAFNNSSFNPIITINNNNQDCRIMTNLNVNGNVNINKNTTIHKNLNVSGNLNINSTTCINLPVGTTSSRPSNPIPGTIRYNSETHNFEGYTDFNGGSWVNLNANSDPKTTFISTVTAAATMKDYAYLTMNNPDTLLNVVSSFGYTGTSVSDGSSAWRNGHLTYSFDYRLNGTYFFSNKMVLFTDDNSADPPDWGLFNFGTVPDPASDYSGNVNNSGFAFFGGEMSYESGATNGGIASIGYIWGFTGQVWVLLWKDQLGSVGTYGHPNNNWYQSGGTVTSGYGKYPAYDTSTITHIGFSVS